MIKKHDCGQKFWVEVLKRNGFDVSEEELHKTNKEVFDKYRVWITPEMESDERKKYIHEIEEINKQIRKRKKELLHIQRWEALEDIKVGRCKIKKNQTVQKGGVK